jgi:Tfp pilus assembly pilus retraction ATPase PilT
MMLIETHLAQLVQQGVISIEEAEKTAFRREEMNRLTGRTGHSNA